MKKRKSLIALLFAFIMLGTAANFAACNDSPTADLHPDSEQVSPLPDDGDSADSSDGSNSANDSNGSDGSASGGSSDTVVTPQQPATPVIQKAQYIRCTSDSVNIRSGAGTEYSVLGSAEKGTSYAVLGKTGNWYKTYYRGKTAYIYASYASVFTLEKTSDAETEAVITEGYKLIGVPYVYGAIRVHNGKGKLLSGFTAQKFDCSSLVQYVFYKGAGKLLDMNTRTQIKQGKYVHPNDLQRGDCIFFTNEDRQYNTGIERVGHVAIYLGNNYILHTASDYARIEKMSSQRWSFYIEARRFL